MAHIGSLMASFIFVWAMFKQYFPLELIAYFDKYSKRVMSFFYPYIQITFHESTGKRFGRSEAYTAIEIYLSSNSSLQAKRLKGDILKNSQTLALSLDNEEEVADDFRGVRVWWAFGMSISKAQTFPSLFRQESVEKGYYKLTFHKRHRDLIIGPYLNYVMAEGKAIMVRNRQRKLYTNNGSFWSHVAFEHPATFESLAMEPGKKAEIIDDLTTFSKAGKLYARTGRAWKRGYLLYGPPGTGKSTMIAAMANLLANDVYDLELTTVKDNTALRRLLMETSSKSVIVIEDIDCSLELTGQRRKQKSGRAERDGGQEGETHIDKEDDGGHNSKVTLSGLLNFIDGLWSACGGERLIVFTTNHVGKLDHALIRRGRMDKHIELSYCSYEAFKILAKKYLSLDSHHLFSIIEELLSQVKITPADVAEHLMPKEPSGDATLCLSNLIEALRVAELQEAAVKEAAEEDNEEEKPSGEEDQAATAAAAVDNESESKSNTRGSYMGKLPIQEDDVQRKA
ncbi:hypothetical protein Nepgr_007010 [Nepenthes gracilis]|uniref:AAA+ ATPase domain-containing protein n=1 Tax=Nepenthes gracilis TaxID=150966 RepID=A0AAD3S664_NEPGR|nr:hypothetical protein Nepgr_007010 [Nepenthes gracilis]